MREMGEEVGECIEYDAWIPIRHPLTDQRVNTRAKVHDHFVLPEQAEALEAHFALEAAPGTPGD